MIVKKPRFNVYLVSDDHHNQRLDNYLFRQWRPAPRSLVYRLIRTKVKVNGKRATASYHLQTGDCLRCPHIALPPTNPKPTMIPPLTLPIIYEDDGLLAVIKPNGLAVHGGSGFRYGVIERLRANRRKSDFLELVHRLDRETSGILLLAKKPSLLKQLQMQWRQRTVKKIYHLLSFGQWQATHQTINLPLQRIERTTVARRVIVHNDGKPALTKTTCQQQWPTLALIAATIMTGRTHQLRVHLATVGLPIVGDDKYGYFAYNRQLNQHLQGKIQLFLHAQALAFNHPQSGQRLHLKAPTPSFFSHVGENFGSVKLD